MKFVVLTLLCALSLAALVRAQEMPCAHAATESLSSRAAELRRRYGYTAPDFLDNNDFGPGKIDGRMGEFFRKALNLLQARARDAEDRRGRSVDVGSKCR